MCLAVPGRVTAIQGDGEFRSARIDFSGVAREVSLAFVPEVVVGDYVLVHVGMAISKLDAAERSMYFSIARLSGKRGCNPITGRAGW